MKITSLAFGIIALFSVAAFPAETDGSMAALRAASAKAGTQKTDAFCATLVESAARNPWNRQSTRFNYGVIRSALADGPYLPAVTPLQLVVLIALEQSPDHGFTPDSLQKHLLKKGFNVTLSSVEECLSRMAARKLWVSVNYEGADPRYVPTAMGLWQIDNCISFYEKLRPKATGVRRRDEAHPLGSYIEFDGEEAFMFPAIGHTAAVILANLSPERDRWLSDLGAELVGDKEFGTPGDTSDVYKITEDMKTEQWVIRYTDRPRGRPSALAREEDYIQLRSTEKGEVALVMAFRFYSSARAVRNSGE